jgi:hypothetical protein
VVASEWERAACRIWYRWTEGLGGTFRLGTLTSCNSGYVSTDFALFKYFVGAGNKDSALLVWLHPQVIAG